MKKIAGFVSLLVLVVISVLFVYNIGDKSKSSLIVKDDNVTVMIDKQIYKLEKGAKVELEENSIVEFIEGNGRVIINEQFQLSSKSIQKSRSLKEKKDFNITKEVANLKKKGVDLISASKEQKRVAVTRKGGEIDIVTGVFVFDSTNDFLRVANDTWSPLPITLKVLDSKGVEIYTDVNKKDNETLFIIAHEFLRDGYRIEVSNWFGLVVDIVLELK